MIMRTYTMSKKNRNRLLWLSMNIIALTLIAALNI